MYRVTDYCNQFNILKFLEDHRKFKEKRDELKEELDSITHLPSKATDVTGIRGGGKSSPTEKISERIMSLEDDIAELDFLMEMYEYGFSQLSEREQDVITLLYSSKRSNPLRRTIYCRKYYTNESDLYSRDKPEAVNHFRLIIENSYRF